MTRVPLPDRRVHWTRKVRIEGSGFFLTVGEYDDGRPGEIWIEAHKTGTFARGILDALARMTSIALQCGCPVTEIIKALRGMHFPPNGEVKGSPFKEATSIADWIAQELEYAYVPKPIEEKVAGYISPSWRSGA